MVWKKNLQHKYVWFWNVKGLKTYGFGEEEKNWLRRKFNVSAQNVSFLLDGSPLNSVKSMKINDGWNLRLNLLRGKWLSCQTCRFRFSTNRMLILKYMYIDNKIYYAIVCILFFGMLICSITVHIFLFNYNKDDHRP